MVTRPDSEILALASSREAYLSLPKELGRAGLSQLLETSDVLRESDQPENLSIAAEAYIEAVLIQSRDEDADVDYLLEEIDRALVMVVESSDRFLQIGHDTGSRDYMINYFRMRNLAAFGDTLKDVVCGEITGLTQQELFLKLQALLAELNSTKQRMLNSDPLTGVVVGAMSEIVVEMLLIADGKDSVIPSFHKADSGQYGREDAHDLVLLNGNEDHDFGLNIKIQVKSGESQLNSSEHGRHYAPDILVLVPPQPYRARLIEELLSRGSLDSARRASYVKRGIEEIRQSIYKYQTKSVFSSLRAV